MAHLFVRHKVADYDAWKAAFEKDIENADDVTELLELVVRNLGIRTFNFIFPPNQ